MDAFDSSRGRPGSDHSRKPTDLFQDLNPLFAFGTKAGSDGIDYLARPGVADLRNSDSDDSGRDSSDYANGISNGYSNTYSNELEGSGFNYSYDQNLKEDNESWSPYSLDSTMGQKMLVNLPVFAAFAIALIALYWGYASADETGQVSVAHILGLVEYVFFLSSSVIAIALAVARFTSVRSFEVSTQKSLGSSLSMLNTAKLIVAVALVHYAAHIMPVHRLSVLLLGWYINPSNWYTWVVLVFDFVSSTSYFTTIAGYALTYGAFTLISSSTLAQVDIQTVLGVLLVSIVSMLFTGVVSSLNYGMVAVNLAASAVLLFSVEQSSLFVSRVNPFVLSVVSSIIEFIVFQKMLLSALLIIINIFLPLTIVADSKAKIKLLKLDDDAAPPSDKSPVISSVSLVCELSSHKDTKAIFQFLLLNSTFMFIQLLYSFRSKSLGLLSDSLHMALDCASLVLGLVAGVLSKYEIDPNGKYPFGLKAFETLAGFANGTLLIGISGSIIFEAIGRLYHPVHLQKTTELLVVSILGLLVNLVGIFAFSLVHGGHSHGHSHSHSHGHSHSHTQEHAQEAHDEHDHDAHAHEHSHAHSHAHAQAEDDADEEEENKNMKGIFLHILADTLGSVGVVISTILTTIFHSPIFDPIASLIIASLIFVSALPLVSSTASSLLLQVSSKKETRLRDALNSLLTIKGLKSYTTPRFWPVAETNALTGYIHIQVYRGENLLVIKKQCEGIFKTAGIDAIIQVENDYDHCWCQS